MATREIFNQVVDRSDLTAEHKQELKSLADAGLTQAVWTRLNDLLIDDLTARNEARQQATDQLDAEVARYTADYEQEKSVLDREMYEELKTCQADEAKRNRLWADYRKKIEALQRHAVTEVKKTSGTILQQVVMAVAHIPLPH
jgi:hypothetical protein